MTSGKCAAQAAHAEMLATNDYFGSRDFDPSWYEPQAVLHREWIDSGHYTKLTLKAANSGAMFAIKHYLEARGYRTYLVIDEGRTEIAPFSPTALAVELVDKDDERVQQHFGEFALYKDKKNPKPPQKKGIFKR